METRTKALIVAGAVLALGTTVAVGASMANDGWRGGPGFERHAGCGFHKGGFGGPGKRGHGAMRMLERYDTDGDGALTQAELDQGRAAQLAEFDANGDGALSLDEFETLWQDFMRERMVDRFQDLDADGDSGVTLDEFQRPFAKMVERFDRNDDGKLSREDRPRRGRDNDEDDN